jgi:osmoprotectant transport system ATP-binding protein
MRRAVSGPMQSTAPEPAPNRLAYAAVSVWRGGAAIVDAVTLAVPAGSFVALTGASGAGKTSLLRLANRLIEVDEGQVLIDGRDVTESDAALLRRRIGYASQGVGLFPHWTVADNIAAVPWLLKHDRVSRQRRVAELLDLVELPQSFGTRMPRQLSGGQASRVGLARALAANPRLLLLDEPFGALDPETRDSLGDRLVALHREQGLTTIMVTHDLTDALLRADRIVVMDAGRVVADAPPAELVRNTHAAVVALLASPLDQARRIAGLVA